MEARNIAYNPLPSPTWNRLRLNRESVSPVITGKAAILTCEGLAPCADAFDGIQTSAGEALSSLLSEAGIPAQAFATAGKTPARLCASLAGSDAMLDLTAAPGCRATVVTWVSPAAEDSALQLRLRLGEGARVDLIQVFDAGEGRVFASLGASLAEGAALNVWQISLSGAYSGFGGRAALEGAHSTLSTRIGYRAAGEEEIDMNWIVPHAGRQTECRIQVNGVLDGSAKKRFRGTIDFLRGAKGAVGAENEDVLLLSPAVINKTLPVILCAEEDVSGTHGATIGRLSDDSLYYFMTRGMDEETARRVMSRARLVSAAAGIPDNETRERLLRLLGEEAEE